MDSLANDVNCMADNIYNTFSCAGTAWPTMFRIVILVQGQRCLEGGREMEAGLDGLPSQPEGLHPG